MFVSTVPTSFGGEEDIQSLTHEELLGFFRNRKLNKIDRLAETLYVQSPEGFHEVLCSSPREAEVLELDLRLIPWEGKLILKSNQFWQGKSFQVGATLRFLPNNRVAIGGADLVGEIRSFKDSEATPKFEVSFGQEQLSWIDVDVDLTKVLVGKKILGIVGRWASGHTELKVGISTLEIETEEGTVVLWHDQACCEDASLHDFEGDAADLIGATVRRVIVGADKDGNTFYDIRTTNGDLWLRFGNGNSTQYSIEMKVGFRRPEI